MDFYNLIKTKIKELSLRDGVIVGSIIIYLIGFVISNIYLATLGVVNLDILRVRYILVGVFFCLFMISIFYPFVGLNRMLDEHDREISFELIIKSIIFTISRFIPIYLGAAVLSLLSGFTNPLDIISNGIESKALQEVILTSTYFNQIRILLLVYLLLFSIPLFLIAIVVFLVNPNTKSWGKVSRSELIYILPRQLIEKKLIIFFVFSFFVFVTILTLGQLIGISTVFMINLSNGWDRFFLGAFLSYAAIWFTFIYSDTSTSAEKGIERKAVGVLWKAGSIERTLFAFFIFLIFVIPVYSLGIYPYLPQQLGGGRLSPVEVHMEKEIDSLYLVDPSSKLYLLDKTNNSYLLVITDSKSEAYEVIEVATSNVDAIIFLDTN